MKTENRNRTFENIILDALRAGGTQDFPPFHIFQAAIGDLAGDYPRERKFLGKTADSKYYGLCIKTVDSIREGRSVNIDPAAQYLQKECMVEKDWAEYITKAMVGAFAAFKGKRASFQQTGIGRKPGASAAAVQGPAPGYIDPGFGMQTVTLDPNEVNQNGPFQGDYVQTMSDGGWNDPYSRQQMPQPQKKSGKKWLKFVIIGIILLFAIVVAVVIFFVGKANDQDDTDATTTTAATTTTTVDDGYYEEEEPTYIDNDVIENDPVEIDYFFVSEPDGYANVREGRGTEYDIVGSLNNGEEVVVWNLEDGWYEIYEGEYAGYYISEKTLEPYED